MTRVNAAGIKRSVPGPPHRSRVAVAGIFFANGAGFATWVPHIPMVQASLGLTPSVLGAALLAMAGGALAGIPLSGRATARFGSRAVVRASAGLFFLALPLPVLAPSLPALVAALFLLGAGNGALDVAMNAQAVAVESRWPRPIMSSFHGMWSLGGLTGAGLAAAALAAGVAPAHHVLAATFALAAGAVVGVAHLLPPSADLELDGPGFVRPTRAIVGLGIVAFLALLSEGAVGDWSALYLERSLGTTSAIAALGYAAIGLGVALVVGHPLAAIAGFAAVGFGIANLIPIVFRAAGALPGIAAGQGIAAVSTFGYVGFLAGPPTIGLVAQLLTLPVALGLIVVSLAWIAYGARYVRAPSAPDR